MALRDELIGAADAFCAAHNISKARLATIVANDGKFFRQLEQGRDCTLRVFERFQQVFEDPATWEAAKEADRQRRRS